MKTSLVTSAVLHTAVLTWMLVSLGGPADFQVSDVEALPVDMVPIEELTQLQQGDKKAPKAEKPSVAPTKRQDDVQNAENAGDNNVDIKSPPKPDARPNNNESAAAPKKTDDAPPSPDPVAEDSKEMTADTPATEVAALPTPKPEVKPEPKPVEQPPEPKPPEEKPAEEPVPDKPDAEALPDKVPTPVVRPKVEQPVKPPTPTPPTPEKAAKASTEKSQQNKKEQKKSSSQNESDFNADEIAALLNKNEPSNGGAKRSNSAKSFGASKTTGNTLSQNEMDALRGQIQKNWSVVNGISGTEGMIITVSFELDQSGNIVGEPQVESKGGSDSARRTMMSGVRRAILKSLPFEGLPADKYDSWREMVVNFDPSSMMIQ